MAFKTRKKEEFSYSSPQEMYQDNKFKKIMGPLDYQAAMLNLYNENADANIYTILITNSKSIDEDARIYAGNIYYVYREEYVSWAIKALTVIRSVWNMFTDEGDMEWRNSVHQQFIKEGITPKNYLDFVCKKNLKDIE